MTAHLWAIAANVAGVFLTIAATATIVYERNTWWVMGTVIAFGGAVLFALIAMIVLSLTCM